MKWVNILILGLITITCYVKKDSSKLVSCNAYFKKVIIFRFCLFSTGVITYIDRIMKKIKISFEDKYLISEFMDHFPLVSLIRGNRSFVMW